MASIQIPPGSNPLNTYVSPDPAGPSVGCTARPNRPPARLWPSRLATAPAWPVVAASRQRRSPSAGSRSRRRPDSGKRERGPEHGTIVAPCCRSEGSAGRLGGGAAPATSGRRYRRVTRSWESRSCRYTATSCTVVTHEPEKLIALMHRRSSQPHLMKTRTMVQWVDSLQGGG
jgi:hypothetical protein